MKTKQQVNSMIETLLSIARDTTRPLAERKVAHAQAYALNWVRDGQSPGDEPIEWGRVCAAEIHLAYVPRVVTVGELDRGEPA